MKTKEKETGGGATGKVNWGNELLASVVVFLVALPLCMGIAIASNVPPALGLITGIVGGLVVGFLAGAPLLCFAFFFGGSSSALFSAVRFLAPEEYKVDNR